jgi:hypothetical protein
VPSKRFYELQDEALRNRAIRFYDRARVCAERPHVRIFRQADQDFKNVRVENLVKYLESIQHK